MTNRELKNQIWGKLMNSEFKGPTLEGIDKGLEWAGRLDAEINDFLSDLLEAIYDGHGNGYQEDRNLRAYAEQHPWN